MKTFELYPFCAFWRCLPDGSVYDTWIVLKQNLSPVISRITWLVVEAVLVYASPGVLRDIELTILGNCRGCSVETSGAGVATSTASFDCASCFTGSCFSCSESSKTTFTS